MRGIKSTGIKAKADRPKYQWAGLIFVLPLLLGLAFVFSNVVIYAVQTAFSEVDIRNGLTTTPAGFENFRYSLRTDARFIKILLDSLQSLVTSIPVILIFSLFVAVVLNSRPWGRTAFRAIFFLPVIACTGLLALLDSSNLVMDVMNNAASGQDSAVISAFGSVSSLLQQMEFSPAIIQFITGASDNILDIVNRSGVQILIFLAGLQSIPVSVNEAARVEGASSWSMFWKITLPMVTPYTLVNVIYTFIESLSRDDTELMAHIKFMAFSKGKYGYASAMSWIYFLCVSLLLVATLSVVLLISRKQRKAQMEKYR